MDNARIKAIIITATLALLGLTAVQFFWIKNSVVLQEQRFSQSVKQALQNLTHKLERKETDFFLDKEDTLRGFNIVSHEEFRYLSRGAPKALRDIQGIAEGSPALRQKIEVKTKVSVVDMHGVQIERETLHRNKSSRERILVVKELDSTAWKQRKEELVNNMISRLALSRSLDVKERVQKLHLDSLLNAELAAFGIDIPYTYNIKNKVSGNLVYEEGFPVNSGASVFKADLFPFDIRGSQEELLLLFPGSRLFIYSQISGMLLTSLLFLSIIVLLFYHTIKILIRQKKLSEIKSDFVNNMTHELKTPISTISLACEALSDPDVQKQDKGGSYLGMIKTESNRLAVLTEKVLQSALFEKQGIKLKKEAVHIKDVLGQAIGHLKMHLEIAKANLNSNHDEIDVITWADKLQLVNLFYNLLDNAIKYSKGKAEIKISCKRENNKLIIAVQDNGIGISRDNQKRVFEKLFRVPTGDTHNVKGFGLGLNYVKAIAEAHGGSVSLVSEEGRGSVFTVVLPIVLANGEN